MVLNWILYFIVRIGTLYELRITMVFHNQFSSYNAKLRKCCELDISNCRHNSDKPFLSYLRKKFTKENFETLHQFKCWYTEKKMVHCKICTWEKERLEWKVCQMKWTSWSCWGFTSVTDRNDKQNRNFLLAWSYVTKCMIKELK